MISVNDACSLYFNPTLVDWDVIAADIAGLGIDISVLAGGLTAFVDLVYSGARLYDTDNDPNSTLFEIFLAGAGTFPGPVGLPADAFALILHLLPGFSFE